jgi:hypothetical protein
VPGDFTTPNERYFAYADWVIRQIADRGILVFLYPAYLGYAGSDEGWYEEIIVNSPERCREYGRYLGQRYRGFDNITWMMGGDRDPEKAQAATQAMVAGIKEFDHRSLFTAHFQPEHSSVDVWPEAGWLDLNTTYTYKLVHDLLRQDYRRTPVRLFVLIESTYEGEHNASHAQIRRQAW